MWIMALHFDKTLKEALKNIEFVAYHEFLIHAEDRHPEDKQKLISRYGEAKWAIIDLLNKEYNEILTEPFDLLNWLHFNENDELAYFLNEVGSNVLSYSQFKIPYKFHLWLGDKGFIVGIEQKGIGFDAEKIDKQKVFENEGAAFNFFRKCRSNVFFDDKNDTKTIYFEYEFC
jgi:hypothetical protein